MKKHENRIIAYGSRYVYMYIGMYLYMYMYIGMYVCIYIYSQILIDNCDTVEK